MRSLTSKNIILCGLPGAGKTTVGKRLAGILNREFIDTDSLIENECGMSCRQYYLARGEEAFRKLEKKAVYSLRNTTQAIIALGGGVVEIEEVCSLIPALGIVIHITEEIDTLIERKIIKDNPATTTDENGYKKLAGRRLPLLKKIANIEIICHDKHLDDILREILWEVTHLETFLK